MRRFDRLLVGLLVLALIHVALRDFSGSEPRRPAPEPAPRNERPLAPPSAGDPTVIVEAEPKRGNATGTAFSVADDGVWLTARHVTSSCRQVWVETAPRRGLPALRVVEHPGADIAVILTRRGAPALALSTRLGRGQEGFHFGFPGGRPGEAHSQLLGRARLRTTGMRHTVEPVVAWAELRRHPDGLDALGGLSGGPVLDRGGEAVGVTIATSRRRGRVFTTAPRSVREVLEQAAVAAAGRSSAAAPGSFLNGADFPRHGDALRARLTVAKVICLAANPRRRPSF